MIEKPHSDRSSVCAAPHPIVPHYSNNRKEIKSSYSYPERIIQRQRLSLPSSLQIMGAAAAEDEAAGVNIVEQMNSVSVEV
jgi:hypothetical protein